MTDSSKKTPEKNGWVGQMMRMRSRQRPDRSGTLPPQTAGQADTTPEATATPDPRARNSMELMDLCGYGENTDPAMQVDEEALQTLCFQRDAELVRPYRDEDPPAGSGGSRRHSRRVRAPLSFVHVGKGDQFLPIEVNVILPAQFQHRVVSGFIHDVNDCGAAFVAGCDIAHGTPVTLCLAHASNATPLLVCDTIIMHSKPLPAGNPVPPEFAGRPLWLHGVSLPSHEALVIYKATLDSLALNAVASTMPRNDN